MKKTLPASFHNNPEAEMFFALYQKKLVQQQGHKSGGRRFLYGYLEGFESVGTQPGSAASATAPLNRNTPLRHFPVLRIPGS